MTQTSHAHEGPRSLSWAISSDRQLDAFDTYRTSLADLYDVTDVANDGTLGFSSRTTAFMFGDSTIAHGRSVAQTMTRGADEIRRSGLEHISIIVNLSETVGDCDGRSVTADPGSVQFRDLSRPSASRVEEIDVINLIIPRATAPVWMLDRDLHGLGLSGTSAGGRLVASHLRTLVDVAAELSVEEGVAAIEAAFIITQRFMGRLTPIAPSHSAAIHRTVRQNATRLIEARLLDGDLDVDAVALAIGVSRSTLYRAFEPVGGVRTFVQHRRLDRAHVVLRHRQGRSPSISEIAYGHGFASDAHFSRAFRNRFGFSPGEIGSGSPTTPAKADVGDYGTLNAGHAQHDILMDWLRAKETAA